LTTFTYLVIGRDTYVTLVHTMGNIIARYYWYHKLIMRVMYVYNRFRSQRTETDTWNRRLLLIKMLLSLIYTSLYEETHQSHMYFQFLVMQTRLTLKLFFPLWERERLCSCLAYMYIRFKKYRYNVSLRCDISREKASSSMIYLTSRRYKCRRIMNASLTSFTISTFPRSNLNNCATR